MSTTIIDFLRGDEPNQDGLTLFDMLDFDDDEFESGHTHIQWMFPLPEPSKAQSPVAEQSVYDAISMDPVLKARMLASLGRFILFLDRTTAWRAARDHNHLRITRVLRCLCWCGLNDPAYDFFEYVKAEVGSIVGKTTLWYWSEAMKRNPAWLTEGE
jgi:hypothetical protein